MARQARLLPRGHPPDAAFWTGIQIGIGLIVVAIVVEAVWAFTALEAPPSFRWAIRSGFVLVVAGLAMGVIMITEGVRQDLDNPEPGEVGSPVISGDAGVVLVPHLVALHGLAVLSALAWLLSFTGLPERRRVDIVRVATASYVVVIAVTLAQALTGRAPLDLLAPAALLLWTSVGVFAAACLATLAGLGGALSDARRSGGER